MVCSPEQSRINGRKSKGALTKRGKAISSKNATKHGLLAKTPPLLASEDLETHEKIIEGLITFYQPQPNDPIASHLIQTVAMGILKQHRLWQAEAALAYQNTTSPPQLQLPYNYFKNGDTERTDLNSPYHPDNLALEKHLLSNTSALLAEYSDLDKLIEEYSNPNPEEVGAVIKLTKEEALSAIWQGLKEELKIYLEQLTSLPYNPFVTLRDQAKFLIEEEQYRLEWQKLSLQLEAKGESYWVLLEKTMRTWRQKKVHSAIIDWLIEESVTNLKTFCKQRSCQIEQIERANQESLLTYQHSLEQYNRALSASQLITPKLELLMRYESHNNKQLMEAISLLEQRQLATENQ